MIRTLLVAALIGLAMPAFAHDPQPDGFHCGETFITLPVDNIVKSFRKASIEHAALVWLEDGTPHAHFLFHPRTENWDTPTIPTSLYVDFLNYLD